MGQKLLAPVSPNFTTVYYKIRGDPQNPGKVRSLVMRKVRNSEGTAEPSCPVWSGNSQGGPEYVCTKALVQRTLTSCSPSPVRVQWEETDKLKLELS